jgi:alpha-galactosidase
VQSDEGVQFDGPVPSDDQTLPASLESSLRPATDYAALAPTPPRGWNSWNAFRCRGLTAERVRTAADVIAESGLGAAGYRHVVIDDCWQDHERDGGGHLVAHPERFAGGIGQISAHVHDRGLSFGIYSSPGTRTCAMIYDDYPGRDLGSYGHEETDAVDFADWGVDYLKYDWCEADKSENLKQAEAFARMRVALDATGRDVVLSLSEYGRWNPWRWAPRFANMWRTTEDIRPTWQSILSVIDQQADLWTWSSPGHWNDPDMLEAGNGSLTPANNRAHLGAWAVLNAPLMLGNDLSTLPDWLLAVLTDPVMLEVQADFAGVQGRRALHGDVDVWAKPMTDARVALLLLNRGEQNATVNVDDIVLAGLPGPALFLPAAWTATWAYGSAGGAAGPETGDGHLRADVPAGDALLGVLSPA